MGNITTREDFHWSYTDEPHASRRKEMLKKYPQIKELYGYDPSTKYLVTWWVLSQIFLAFLLKDASWFWMVFVAYTYGAVAAQALFLAMHEISHNLLFKSVQNNRLFGYFSNISTVVPHFSMFVKYHMEHHRYQGVEGVDVDVPTKIEGKLCTNPVTKTLWVICQPLIYALRPLFVKPKQPGWQEFINWTTCIVADIFVLYFWGLKSLLYLLLSGLLGAGLHPLAGHFIAEHYVFVKGQETYSYYGPLNLVSFNVGYHNEHHDFPKIPGSRLPKVREIAPEYYESLPHHKSWAKVIWDYIWDPQVGPFSRVKRGSKKTATQ